MPPLGHMLALSIVKSLRKKKDTVPPDLCDTGFVRKVPGPRFSDLAAGEWRWNVLPTDRYY